MPINIRWIAINHVRRRSLGKRGIKVLAFKRELFGLNQLADPSHLIGNFSDIALGKTLRFTAKFNQILKVTDG